MAEIKITERGWPGHFICANKCRFRKNTLIECGEKRVVVSTVGDMLAYNPLTKNNEVQEIGFNRYYETMAFKGVYEDPYWEADVSQQIAFDSEWTINHISRDTDLLAEKMHENVVKEIIKKLSKESEDKE